MLVFAVLVVVLSVPLWVVGAGGAALPRPFDALPVSALSAAVPAIAAFSTAACSGRGRELRRRLSRPRGALRWWLLAAAMMSVPVLAGGVLAGGNWPRVEPVTVAAVVLIFLAAALGEEVGWTAFALPRLHRLTGSLAVSTLILIAGWGLWHLIPYLQTGQDASWVVAQLVQLALMRTGIVALAGATGDRGWIAVIAHAGVNSAWALGPTAYEPWLVNALAVPLVATAVVGARRGRGSRTWRADVR